MKWSEMTPEQRDELVHEKIMGRSSLCNGNLMTRTIKHPLDTSPASPYDPIDWVCTKCGAQGGCRSKDAHLPHNARIPLYSSEMGDAWLIVKKIEHVDLYYHASDPEPCEVVVTHNEDGGQIMAEAWSRDMPEAICIAALRSAGVEIEQ